MSRPYPNAQTMIRDRARLLYGSVSYLSRLLGMSRQALHGRILLATESPSSHPWFEFILLLPEGSIAKGTTPELLDERPDPASLAYVVSASDQAWKNRRASRGAS
jgi:hypothetical protein